ncbi:MAG TPA: hypothetical protein EYQ86_00240 [Bacteroidetes bacterium]|nr:hypothetical protein [Bacteroidota bacterium]
MSKNLIDMMKISNSSIIESLFSLFVKFFPTTIYGKDVNVETNIEMIFSDVNIIMATNDQDQYYIPYSGINTILFSRT